MADDPNRDILPVKDDSCYGSIRCFSEIDPRERHIVCKLDRYQLEDRYLRLLEEVQGLKKLSNSQEDKIKRLGTKLMRSAASSRTCPAVLAINDERERITRLELENARLKDKAYTLKNQLLSHRGPRSPSRCRRVASGISSGPTTYRSESARTKYQPQQRDVVDDNDTQNYIVKIEELETQRNEMITRIAELEGQIAVHVAGIQREKVQDNVEYIRMWRQMKQANDKLISVQATNDTLHSQIGDLKKLLEETTKNNREVTAALVSEKQRLLEIDNQIASAKDSQLSLREKNEQIRDLTNEMKILQQHNNELIALSSKFGQVEVENIELKRKVSEYVQDNQSLKSAFSSEQADHRALKSANNKLIKKIEELQKNMDNLTMQLMKFQNQEVKNFISKGTQTEEVKQVDKKIGESFVSNGYSISSEEEKESLSDKLQRNELPKLRFSNKEKPGRKAKKNELVTNSINIEVKDRSTGSQSVTTSVKNSRTISNKTKVTHNTITPSISREKILMLLDQAQISTPLEAQNAARIRQIDVAAGQNDASIFPESYRNPITTLQQCSNDDFTLTNISSTPGEDDDRSHEQTSEFFDPKQILLKLFEILKNCSEKIHENVDSPCICSDLESSSSVHVDYRNFNNLKYDNGNDNTCEILYKELKTGLEKSKTTKEKLLNKFTETECCNCESNHRCLASSDCGYGCCTPDTDHGLIIFEKNNYLLQNNPAIVKSRVGEISSTIQKVFDSMYMGRDFNYGCAAECYDLRNEIKPLNPNNQSKIDKSRKAISGELERSKEHCKVKSGYKNELAYEKKQIAKLQKNISNYETNCHTANECIDTPGFCETSAFPLLITKGQGLIEIHIQALQLSAKATQTLFKNDPHDMSVFISCDVWDQETTFTPILNYPSLTFNSSSVYRVCELQKFFNSVLREHIIFQVHVINPDEETFTVAKAKLSVKDILDYPQNKLHYITPVFSMIPCSCGGDFGQLLLWIKLSCDIDLVENFKDRCGLSDTAAPRNHQQMQISTYRGNEKAESSSSAMNKDFLSINSSPLDNLYSFSELNTAPVRDVIQEIPEKYKRDSVAHPLEAKSNRLDTIRESEPGYMAKSNEKIVKKGKYRNEDPDEGSPIVNIKHEPSSLTPSISTNEYYSQGSDAGIDEPIEATTPQDVKLAAVLQKKRESGEQIESRSITEFNNILKNQTDGSNLRETGSTINDLGMVISDSKWEKYKNNRDPTSISLPRKSKNSDFKNIQDEIGYKNVPGTTDTITISIVAMNLFDKTSLMQDPDVDLLYVEYSFLGMRGADMETNSLPKPNIKGETMAYNFTRKFQVDEGYHNSHRNMLTSMLSGTASPIVRFIIVSEPSLEEMDTKECVEVGHADFNIREYALGDGLRDVQLIIMNPLQSEQLGILKITIDGVEIIRNCMMVNSRL